MIDRLLSIFARLLNRLPRHTVLALGQTLGGLLYIGMPYRKDVAWNNLALAFPRRTKRQRWSILFGCYRHFGMVFTEFMRMPDLSNRDLEAIVEFDETHLQSAVTEGRGALIMTGHLGNWEIAVQAISRRGFPLSVVAVRQRGPGGGYLESLRASIGIPSLSKGATGAKMLEAIGAGRILGLAGDQDARSRGYWVTFFGIPSSRFRGFAIFALRTGATMLFFRCFMDGDRRYHLEFVPISGDQLPSNTHDAALTLTQRYMDSLQAAVEQHPEQYFWFHRMWKSEPPSGRGANEARPAADG